MLYKQCEANIYHDKTTIFADWEFSSENWEWKILYGIVNIIEQRL